jgi:RNA polymerase sigma factor (sigma-70 family)
MQNQTLLSGMSLVRLLKTSQTDASDGDLLNQFLVERDEGAFATIVERHGPMVLGVCRRIMGSAADVEDTFQATFLVLVRKAPTLTAQAVLGDWLHGVARRVALKARSALARRRLKEATAARVESQPQEVRNDWLPLLDEEVGRLPEKYRLVVVLCDLQCQTRVETARQLGWPEGTVAARLSRGRALLAKRLLRRALVVAGGLMPTLTGDFATGAVPTPLLMATVRLAAGNPLTTLPNAAAEALARSVLQPATVSLGIAVAVCAVVLGIGFSVFGLSLPTQQPGVKVSSATPTTPLKEEAPQNPIPARTDPQDEMRRLAGTWVVVEGGGRYAELLPTEQKRGARWIIENGSIIYGHELEKGPKDRLGRYFNVDATKDPKRIEITYTPEAVWDGQAIFIEFGVYAVEGNRLTIYMGGTDRNKAPTAFPPPGSPDWDQVLTLERELPKTQQIAADSPGQTAEAKHQKPMATLYPGGIDAVVRGVLKFKTGRGYFIDTHNGNGAQPPDEVWLSVGEDKIASLVLTGLLDKDVTATGMLLQQRVSYSSAVPGLAMYLTAGFKIQATAEMGEKAAERGVKAEVRGVLKYQIARVERGQGYHVVFTVGKDNPVEMRVWLWYIGEPNQKKIDQLLDKEVFVTGWLQQESGENLGLPHKGMAFYTFEIRESPGDVKKPKTE